MSTHKDIEHCRKTVARLRKARGKRGDSESDYEVLRQSLFAVKGLGLLMLAVWFDFLRATDAATRVVGGAFAVVFFVVWVIAYRQFSRATGVFERQKPQNLEDLQ